jgi:hypothetical protein
VLAKRASTHFGDSVGELIFSDHDSLWDGDLQQQQHHRAIHLHRPRGTIYNYLHTTQAYNTNVLDRSHVVMHVSSSHVNMHNSYSSVGMSRWSNNNAYITEHVSNIHNRYVPPYSSIELASHCTPQTHMPMSNCYSRTDMRASADFGQLLYTASNSIRMKIAPNMILAPSVVSSVFHSTSHVYS